MNKKIIILGAGLTGLSIAYLLKKNGIRTQILEARNRIGGRIETIKGNQDTPIEMGATWLGEKHKTLVNFLNELGIEKFKQYNHGIAFFETMSFAPPQEFLIPESTEPSFRIKGGSSQLIEKLVSEVVLENITLNQVIIKIEKQDDHVHLINRKNESISADLVISTLPPKLFAKTISCTPSLPQGVLNIFNTTQTWMENSIKFGVEYSTPFWKKNGQAGSVFSQSSIIPEMYDHTNFEENKFALKGFLNGSASQYSKQEREEKVIATLVKFFGKEAENHIGYFDNNWENERFTFSPSDTFLFGHQNNGHHVYQNGYWENQLWFAGTETSMNYGGYMEGAIQSAQNTVHRILQLSQVKSSQGLTPKSGLDL